VGAQAVAWAPATCPQISSGWSTLRPRAAGAVGNPPFKVGQGRRPGV